MLKQVRKTIVMLALGVVLTVSVFGATTVTQAVTGHTPTAHADGLGGSVLDAECWAGAQGDPSNPAYMIVDGQNQYGNWVEWGGNMNFVQGVHGDPNFTDAATSVNGQAWWWINTVYVTIWDGNGNLIENSTPVYIDPSTYGYLDAVWVC